MCIICGDAHHFVAVRKIWVVESIEPVPDGLNIINMLQSTTWSLGQNTRYTELIGQYEKLE